MLSCRHLLRTDRCLHGGGHFCEVGTHDELGNDERTFLNGVAQFVNISVKCGFDIVDTAIEACQFGSRRCDEQRSKPVRHLGQHAGTIHRAR